MTGKFVVTVLGALVASCVADKNVVVLVLSIWRCFDGGVLGELGGGNYAFGCVRLFCVFSSFLLLCGTFLIVVHVCFLRTCGKSCKTLA